MKYSKILKTNHEEFICKSTDLIDLIPKFINAFDEPFADSSAIPSLYLNKKSKNYVTVTLSGDGADESFFGYNHFYVSKWVLTAFKLPFLIREIIINFLPIRILSFLLKKDKRVIKEILFLKILKTTLKEFLFHILPFYL